MPTHPMIKRLLAFLAVIWLIIAILAPSFLAPQIDAQLHAFFDSAEAHRLRANGIDLQLDNYQRGYFSSQADIHINIRPYDGQPTWYRTTLHARINHAPLFNSGINLISATLTNSDSDGRYAPYLPDGHLRLQTRIAILGQIHQLIRIEPNHTTNLNSDGLRLSWHSHIRTPDRGNGCSANNNGWKAATAWSSHAAAAPTATTAKPCASARRNSTSPAATSAPATSRTSPFTTCKAR